MTAKPPTIRKKRNFKALKLDPTADSTVAMSSDVRPATKPATGKKRPPPMTLKAPKIGTSSTTSNNNDHDGNLLTVSNGLPSSAPPTASASKTYHSALSEKLANFGEDLKNEDLKDIQELGQGNGGSVKKVEHTPTGTIMAKKVCLRVRPPPIPSASIRAWFCACSKFTDFAHTDRVNRRKAIGQETDPAGTADHARLQFTLYHLVLRRVHLGSQYLHLHGVYG